MEGRNLYIYIFPFPFLEIWPFPFLAKKKQEVQRKKRGLKSPVSSLLGLRPEFSKGVDTMQDFFLDIIPPTATAQMKKASCYGGRVMFYKPANVKKAEKTLIDALLPFRPVEPLDGPLFLQCQWIFPKGKSHKDGEWRTTKPDTDNLQKMLKDVMTQTGYWVDDSRVVSELVTKKWGSIPGIAIKIIELDKEEL